MLPVLSADSPQLTEPHHEKTGLAPLFLATWTVQYLFFLTQNFKLLGTFCSCTGRFVSDLVRNRQDRFSGDVAQHGHENISIANSRKKGAGHGG